MKTRKEIEQQILNLLVARAMMDEIPKGGLATDLSWWTTRKGEHVYGGGVPACDLLEHRCGSAACFGGWVAVHPFFNKQGVYRGSMYGEPRMGDGEEDVANELFGDYSMFDAAETFEPGWPNTRKVVLNRIKHALDMRCKELENLE